MATSQEGPSDQNAAVLIEILATLKTLQADHHLLASSVDAITGRVNMLAGVQQIKEQAIKHDGPVDGAKSSGAARDQDASLSVDGSLTPLDLPSTPALNPEVPKDDVPPMIAGQTSKKSSTTSRIILTSYPNQSNVRPVMMNWGHVDPNKRGPVVVSRNHNTIGRRNGMSLFSHNKHACSCSPLPHTDIPK